MKAVPLLLTTRPSLRSATTAASAASPASLQSQLTAEFKNLSIADTHEHFFDELDRVKRHVDFFSLVQGSYVESDLVSAGMPEEALRVFHDQQALDSERWRAMEPYWKLVRFTGYAQALQIAVHDLYGGNPVSGATIRSINETIASQNRPGLYRSILNDHARIRFCVEDDSCNGCTRIRSSPQNFEYIVLARRFDKFIIPATLADIHELESATGVSITNLQGLKQAADRSFQQNLDQGMRAVKVAVAYYRELHFDEVGEAEAESDFEALIRQQRALPQGFRAGFVRPFRRLEDHMFHHIMRLAEAHHLPVQIHTGIFAGTGGVLTNSRPTLLINTFNLYPQIPFDIFHLSFPYQDELGALARAFPNVHADFCWANVISPPAARRAFDEFLESMPLNKILAFGGDYMYPELSYGHAEIARRTLAEVLAGKVESGWCTEEDALDIGRRLLYDNAAEFFSWQKT
ncbi:MAG TPA: amidohydrolase family protein [Acidobacteriaceae bacterium]|nr:amidohydrolase family protein [Acidobacteriaceae bacterium]